MQAVFEIAMVLCSSLGLVSVLRIATLHVRSRRLSPLDMTKIGTAVCLLVFALVKWWRPTTLMEHWYAWNLPLALGAGSAFLLGKMRDSEFEKRVEEILLGLIGRMREGESLTSGFESVAHSFRSSLRHQLLDIHRLVAFSPQADIAGSTAAIKMVRELRRIDAISHGQVRELERWRTQVRIESDFRRRSRQATAQVRAQSTVLGLMFVVLAGVSCFGFGFSRAWPSLKLAIPFFLLGLLWIWRGGRRVKWTV